MKRISTLEQHISPDSWIKIFSYLLASDAIRLTSCSKYLHERVGENEFVWRELLTWGDAQLLRQVVNQSLSFKQLAGKPVEELKSVDETPKASSSSSFSVPISCDHLRSAARDLEGASDLSTLSWELLKYPESSSQIEGMEAHAAVTVLDRFVVIIGGWGASSSNELYVLDGAALPEIVRVATKTIRIPRFKYGFSATLLSMPDTSPITQTDFKGASGGSSPSKGLKGPSSAIFNVKAESGETVSSSRRIIVFGGCTTGGYAGDCADMHYVDLEFVVQDLNAVPSKIPVPVKGRESSYTPMDHDQNVVHRETITSDEEILKIPISLSVGSPEKRLKIYATYTRVPIAGEPAPGPNRPGNRDELRGPYDAFSRTFNNTGSENTRSNLPSTRGYHTANIVTLNGNHSLLVWGGLHHRGPTTKLEVFDLETNVWRAEIAQGIEPSKRFGHSAILVGPGPGSDSKTTEQRLVFTGGSDGNDLIRNGRDFKDVHILTILAGDNQGNKSGKMSGREDVFVWSTPVIHSLSKGYQHPLLLPGRCHSAALIGDNILYFGGGANNSNGVSVLKIGASTYVQGDSTTNSKSCSNAIESSLKSVHERSEKKENNNKIDDNDKNDDNNNDNNSNTKNGKKEKSLDESSLRIPIFRPVFVQPNSYKRHYPFTAAEKQEERRLKNEKSSSSLHPKKSGRNDDEDDDERFSRPCPLISTAAVHVGKYFLIFGGFNNRLRERAEIWLLDLAASTSLAARRSAVSYRGPNSTSTQADVSSVSVGTMLPIETAEDEDDITWGLYKSTDEDYEDDPEYDRDDDDDEDGGDSRDLGFDHFMQMLRRHMSPEQLAALGIVGRNDVQALMMENDDEEEEEEGEGEEGDDENENEEDDDEEVDDDAIIEAEIVDDEEDDDDEDVGDNKKEEYEDEEVELDEPDSESENAPSGGASLK